MNDTFSYGASQCRMEYHQYKNLPVYLLKAWQTDSSNVTKEQKNKK